MKHVQFVRCERKIDTIRIVSVVSNHIAVYKDSEIYIKQDMARKIVNKLIADGYIEFRSEYVPAPSIPDCTRIEARLDVLKPIMKEDVFYV